MEKLLTVDQISDLIQYSRSTIYEWIHIGLIPHYKFSNGVRFRASDIEKWLKRRKKKGRTTYSLEIEQTL